MCLCAQFYYLTAVVVSLLFSNNNHSIYKVLHLYPTQNKMPKFYVCQLFKDYSIVHLMRNREWKWFRINRKWETIYYDRSDFFIIA